MNLKYLIATLAVATCAISAPVMAQEGVQDPFMLFTMPMIDKNKDGMVSKKEFMSMMDKAFDMQIKKTGAKKGMMTDKQMEEFLKSLFAG